MRITASVLAAAPQITNPLGEREIDLRGLGLQAIESTPLELLEDCFDTIDFSDNNITRIDSFPSMPRLSTIVFHNNKCSRISSHTAASLPNVHTIAAHNNLFAELTDMEPLAEFRGLQRLSLLGCPVTRKPHYRLFVISRCPSLKLLDFARVRDVERADAKALFPPQQLRSGAAAAATTAREERRRRRRERLEGGPSAADQPSATATEPPPPAVSLENLEERIRNATSMEEIEALEAELALQRNRKQRKTE